MDMYLIYNIGGNKAEKEMTYQILMLLEMVLIFVSPIIVVVVVVELYSAEKMLCLQEAGHFLIQCYDHHLSPSHSVSIYIYLHNCSSKMTYYLHNYAYLLEKRCAYLSNCNFLTWIMLSVE